MQLSQSVAIISEYFNMTEIKQMKYCYSFYPPLEAVVIYNHFVVKLMRTGLL